MNPLEEKVLELLPLLSEEAKKQAYSILGKPAVKKKTRKELTKEYHRALLRKALKIDNRFFNQ